MIAGRQQKSLLDSYRASSEPDHGSISLIPQLQEIIAFKQQEITFQNAKHDLIIIKSITHFVAYEQLKMQNHFLEMLTATISHDMRTPLNAILGMGANLQQYVTHPQGIKFHQVLTNSSKLLLFLVNDFLDLFRFKNGKLMKNESLSNFRQQIDELIEIFKIQANQKGLTLVFDCDPSIPEEFTIDIQRIKQVLINLIGNSLKFTFKGSIVVSAKAFYTEDGPVLEMRVCDTGVGIKEEDKRQIFQMFGKLESTAHINTSGVGLGVSICKMIVEALEGTIDLANGCDSMHCLQGKVRSNIERIGTTFCIQVKLKSEEIMKYQEQINISLEQITPILVDYRHDSGSLWHQIVDTNFNGIQCGARKLADQISQGRFENDTLSLVNLVQKYKRKSELQSVEKFIRERSLCPCKERKDILVVDDNVFNLITLQSILHETFKIDSDSAMNGEEAVECVKERQLEVQERPCICGMGSRNYKFIFMDCNMPVMDGLQATGLIKKISPQIFIAALTAYTTDGFEQKCFQAGMDVYLTKPISRDRLLVLKELINIARNA
ncbi:hypothetical protein FGO68_gene16545 [Halteria grandinella]|uniref:Histidine kinase n=1 Tax=Halteria grandinella TaxID=5974 RepID=A0A8J8NXP6_HALGN|nr:hypothetical protein FGO68_gene16545 [Halteria grandinella]